MPELNAFVTPAVALLSGLMGAWVTAMKVRGETKTAEANAEITLGEGWAKLSGGLQAEVSALRERVSTLEATLLKANAERSELVDRITTLTSELANERVVTSQLRTELAAMRARVAVLEKNDTT